MPFRRRSLLACASALVGIVACGGLATSGPVQGEALDATSLLDGGADGAQLLDAADAASDGRRPDSPDCSTCGDASTADATDATVTVGDASDGGASTSGDQDADAGLVYDDLCHVLWPQPLYVYVAGIQMAAASSGDVYLAINYNVSTASSILPPLDLGDAGSLSHPTGVAIVKVDSACRPVWVREIGAAAGTSLGNRTLAVDAQGVTVMGAFGGTVDFAGTTLSNVDAGLLSSPASPYLMRFDATGQVVYAHVILPSAGYNELSAGSLAVGPDGTATVAVWEASLHASDGAVSQQAAQYIVQFDASGTMVSMSTPSMADPHVGPGNDMAADPDGGLWVLGGNGDGVTAPYSTSLVYHMAGTGTVDWMQPIDAGGMDPLFAAGGGNAYLFNFTGGVNGPEPITETLRPFTSSGTSPWSQGSTAPSYASSAYALQMVIDANGNAIVGGEFSGTYVNVDGSTVTDPNPTGVGFQTFDSTGHLRHMKTWNGTPPDSHHFGAIAVDPQGKVLLAGTEGAGAGDTSMVFLAKLAQ